MSPRRDSRRTSANDQPIAVDADPFQSTLALFIWLGIGSLQTHHQGCLEAVSYTHLTLPTTPYV